MNINLSPYRKTVIAAIGTVVAVGINVILGNDTAASLGTAVMGLLTTIGVFRVTNVPAEVADPNVPSAHVVTVSKPTPAARAAKQYVDKNGTIKARPAKKSARKNPSTKKSV